MTGRIIRSVRTGTKATMMPDSAGGWDVHAHVIPPELIRAAEAGRFTMSREAEKIHICGHGVPIHPISDVGKLCDRIGADGLDGALVSAPPLLFRPDLNDDERRDYVMLVNDGLAAVCKRHPASLRPMAYLPAEAPELAAAIASGLGTEWAGVCMGTDLGALTYSDARFDPLWETLQSLGLPLFIHPGSSPDQRLSKYYLENLLGNPNETTICAAHLVFAGVFNRYPRLKIILAHGGGCVAALVGRWQRGVDTARPGVPVDLIPRPIEAVKQFYIDSIVHNSAYLDYLIGVLGHDRILYGSDWPFPMGSRSVDEALGSLPANIAQAIRKDNAVHVYGIRLGR